MALNQLVLGPYVIAVVFAWNSLWQGKLDKLPAMYSDHAVSTLINGMYIPKYVKDIFRIIIFEMGHV